MKHVGKTATNNVIFITKFKEDEMGGACTVAGRSEKCIYYI
jgi:hypothetical protein